MRPLLPVIAVIALGLWLMAAPAVLAYGDPAATSDRIVGPIVASFATVAMWEATRSLGRMNAAFGFWLVIAPVVLGYPLDATVNSVAVGLSVIACALLQRPPADRFGGGWAALRRMGRSGAARRD